MKKILCLVVVLTFVFTLAACGKAPAAVVDPGENAVAAEDTNGGAESEEIQSTTAPTEAAQIFSPGTYYGIDRFSGESVSGSKICVYKATESQLVLDYYSPNGTTFTGATVSLNSSGKGTYTSGTITLDITVYANEIHIDEIEGMGAVAYLFR